MLDAIPQGQPLELRSPHRQSQAFPDVSELILDVLLSVLPFLFHFDINLNVVLPEFADFHLVVVGRQCSSSQLLESGPSPALQLIHNEEEEGQGVESKVVNLWTRVSRYCPQNLTTDDELTRVFLGEEVECIKAEVGLEEVDQGLTYEKGAHNPVLKLIE